MTKGISAPMKEFLQQYLDWAESDATIESEFSDGQALCGNLIAWETSKDGWLLDQDVFHLRWELNDMFERSNMNTNYPFGAVTYHRERGQKSHHQNPQRLAWVRKQLS